MQIPMPRSRSSTPEFDRDATPPPGRPEAEAAFSPRNNLQRNMQWVELNYPDYRTNRSKSLLERPRRSVPGRRRYLHASRLTCHYVLLPVFYQPNRHLLEINAGMVLRKLARFRSLHPRSVYRAISHQVIREYLRIFSSRHSTEASIRRQFAAFTTSVIHAIDFTQKIDTSEELYAAAAGLLAKSLPVTNFQVVDLDAGYLGRTDEAIFFGDGEPELKEEVLCAVEFKLLDETTAATLHQHRWFSQTGALLPQVLQSLFGHDAPVAVAITGQGLKVFLKETDGAGVPKIFFWPPGPHFYHPNDASSRAATGGGAVDQGLEILLDIVRIATRNDDEICTRRRRVAIVDGVRDFSGVKISSRKSVRNVRAKLKEKTWTLTDPMSGSHVHIRRLCLRSRLTTEELIELSDTDTEDEE